MKKSRITRIIGAVICLALVLVMIPVSSFADDGELTIDSGDTGSADAGAQDGELTLDQSTDQSSDGTQDPGEDGELSVEGEEGEEEEDEESEEENPDDAGDQDDIVYEGTGIQLANARILPASANAAELKEAQRINIIMDVKPETVESGDAATMTLVMTYNSAGSTVVIDPEKVKAVITIPKGIEEQVIGNQSYEHETTTDSQTNDTIVTLTLTDPIRGGTGTSCAPMTLNIPKGVTDHGTEYQVSVKWYYDGEELKESITFDLTSVTDKFNWQNLARQIDKSDYTVSGNNSSDIDDVKIYYTAKSEFGSDKDATGVSYTESIVIEDEYTIDDRIILTDESQIVLSNGGSIKDVVKTAGRIKSFKYVYEMERTGEDDMVGIPDASLTFKGLQVDDEKVKEELGSGQLEATIADAIHSSGLNATMTPAAKLDPQSDKNSATSTVNGRPAQVLQSAVQGSIKVVRKFDEEKIIEISPSGTVKLDVSAVYTQAGVLVPGRTGYVRPNERITFRMYDFTNESGSTMKTARLENTINLDEMYPEEIYTGNYSTNYAATLLLYSNTSGSEEVIYSGLGNANMTITFANLTGTNGQKIDPKTISKVALQWSSVSYSVNAGNRWKPYSSPTITMRVLDSGAINPTPGGPGEDPYITNQVDFIYVLTEDGVDVEYSYDKLSESAKKEEYNHRDTQSALYYGPDEEEDGDGTDSKTYTMLRQKTPGSATIQNGDLLEFTISFTITLPDVEMFDEVNYPQQDAIHPFVDDEYKGLKPFTNQNDDRLTTYGDLVKLVSVVDKTGRDVTAERGLSFRRMTTSADNASYPGIYPTMTQNTARYEFTNADPKTGNFAYPHAGNMQLGDIVTFTYVMEVTNSSNMENSFVTYSNPTGSSTAALITMEGGRRKVDRNKLVSVRPNIIMSTEITHEDGTLVSANRPFDDGDTYNVKVTLVNESPANAIPIHFHGWVVGNWIGAGDTGANSKFISTSGKVTYDNTKSQKVYTSGKELTSEARSSSTNMTSYSNRWRWHLGNDSIELAPDQSIVIEYQAQVEGYVADTSSSTADFIATIVQFMENQSFWTMAGKFNTSATSINYDIDSRTNSGIHQYGTVQYSRANYKIGIKFDRATNIDVNKGSTTLSSIENKITVRNYGRALEVDAFIVRLSKYETIRETPSSSYTYVPLGKHGAAGEEREIYKIIPTNPYFPGYSNDSNNYSEKSLTIYTQITEEYKQILLDEASRGTPINHYVRERSTMEVAIYGEKFADHMTSADSDTISVVTDRNAWGGNSLGFNGRFFKKDTITTINYQVFGPAPGLLVKMQKKMNNEYVTVADTVTYSPQDKVAYNVEVGIQNDTDKYVTKMQSPVLVTRLPQNTTFDTEAFEKWRNDHKLYSASEITMVEHEFENETYIVMKVGNEDITVGRTREYFIPIIVGSTYGSKSAAFYLRSYDQFFSARDDGQYGTRISKENSDLPNNFVEPSVFNPAALKDYMVVASKSLNVTGKFGFTAEKSVEIVGGTVDGNTVTAPSRENQTLAYTLRLNNNGTESSYKGVTLIERLPGNQDQFIMDPVSRNSTVPVKMVNNQEPVVRLSGSSSTLVKGVDYKLTYANAAPNTKVVGKDLNLEEKDSENSQITWRTDLSPSQATMFRIELLVDLPANATLEVTFNATASMDDMPKTGAVAVNTFGAGFVANTGTRDVEVYPESESVKVVFPDENVMTVKGIVFNDLDGDGIYTEGVDTLFTAENIDIQLFEEGGDVPLYSASVTNGAYEIKVDNAGTYVAKIIKLSDNYEVYDGIIRNNPLGNMFGLDRTSVDPMTHVINVSSTHVRNAAIVESIEGSLTIDKKLSGLGGSSVGGKVQKFVFRIDYTPPGGTEVTQTFYEVIQGQNAREITGLPKGTYVVTEVAWATGFQQVGVTTYENGINEIALGSKKITAVVTNERDRKDFLHAISDPDAVNVFPKSN